MTLFTHMSEKDISVKFQEMKNRLHGVKSEPMPEQTYSLEVPNDDLEKK